MTVSQKAAQYVCPACTAPVAAHADRYDCTRCDRQFPVLFDIPDFRLRSDRYLSLEAERDKARRLFEAASTRNFEDLLYYYYSITDDVAPARAKVFAGYVLGGVDRASADLENFESIGRDAAFLDAGCGAGAGLVAAQGRFSAIVGVDIALRWLVICQKRLQELGAQAQLVCADLEALPFVPGGFSHLVAADVLEHVYDPATATASLARQLKPGGQLWITAINRRWIGPDPSTGIWAAGLRRGPRGPEHPLRFVTHLAASDIEAFLERAGLETVSVRPRRVATATLVGRSPFERAAVGAYAGLSSAPALRGAMAAFGPAFEVMAKAPATTMGGAK